MAVQPKTLRTEELATQLGRSVVTLERWRRLRKGPPYIRMMGRVIYRQVDVDAWLEKQRQEPEASE
jgi:predicted site-specific integrase-resolvase